MSVSVGSASTSASPGKMGAVRSLVRIGLGPPAGDEVAVLVCVAAALAADGEVEQLTGLARRLADMATAARTVSVAGIDDLLDVRIGCAHSSAEGRPGGQVNGLALLMLMRAVRIGSWNSNFPR